MKVSLIALTHSLAEGFTTAHLIEYAGRICTATHPGTWEQTERFIKARIKQGHESILEHVNATFEIDGISRACSHQLVRHRLASYSQLSQRYTQMGSYDWVMPLSIQGSNAEEYYKGAMATCWWIYEQLIARGIPKEDARYVLPNATTTRLIMTANLREWRHIVKLRTSKAAQWEIRGVANEILKQLHKRIPSVFEDLKEARDAG